MLRWGGLAWPGLTRAATRLCVCEDPRLRRRRRAPPLGELRVPLRKLVPNRARSFDVCLEKRKLVSEAGTGKGVGTRMLAVGKLERGGARRGPRAVSGQGDQALCSFRPRDPRAWTQRVACPCTRRWVGRWDQAGMRGAGRGPRPKCSRQGLRRVEGMRPGPGGSGETEAIALPGPSIRSPREQPDPRV